MSQLKRAKPLLGTLVDITAEGRQASLAIDAAFQIIETIHHLMSFHEAASDVSRINHAPAMEPLTIDPHSYAVLITAQTVSRLSEGAFDITVAQELVKHHLLPAPYPLLNMQSSKASFQDIILLPDNKVMLKKPLWIDLGGIAKGYAVDQAIKTLQNYEITSAVVNAGGDLRMFGSPYPVHIRHPDNAMQVYPLGMLSNTAVASSSGYYSNDNDTDMLVDPFKGKCVRWRYGVTIITEECMIADALTKVVRLARADHVMAALTYYDADAFMVDHNGVHRLDKYGEQLA